MKGYASCPCFDCRSSHCNSKVAKRCVVGMARPGQVRELTLEHLAAAEELQRALKTSYFASTLQAEGKS